ncbi:MAG: hypothetical protein ABI859_18910 [Pseudomonadota bacterium]
MKMPIDRRKFLRSSLGGAALSLGASLLGTGRVLAAGAVRPLASTRLDDDLLLISGGGGNVVVARDAQGLVFVDGALKARSAEVVKLATRTLGARHAHTLLNTHWHPEVTGLNEQLGKEGAKIIAHENTRLWLSTDVQLQVDAKPIPRLPPKALPNATTYGSGKLDVGNQELRYGYLSQAHTDGDLYALFVKSNVLVTGGVVAGGTWPTADWVTGGWINGTVAGYKTLIDLCDANTRVVTAQGTKFYTRAELEDERAMLAKLADQLGKMLRAGFAPADMLAATPAKEYTEKMGDPTQFLTESFKSLWPRFAPDA